MLLLWQFAEVVVHAVDAGVQHDAAEDVIGGDSARRADGVLAVEITSRLDLGDRVACLTARLQVREQVAAVGVGRRRQTHWDPIEIGAGELHSD